MGDDGNKPENEGDKKVVHVYPLVKVSDNDSPESCLVIIN